MAPQNQRVWRSPHSLNLLLFRVLPQGQLQSEKRSTMATVAMWAPKTSERNLSFWERGALLCKQCYFPPPPFLWPLFSMSPSMQSCITVPVVKALKETQLSGWRTRKGSPGKLESMRENLWRRDQKKVIPNPMYKPTQTPNSLSHAAHVQMCSNSVEKAAHRR